VPYRTAACVEHALAVKHEPPWVVSTIADQEREPLPGSGFGEADRRIAAGEGYKPPECLVPQDSFEPIFRTQAVDIVWHVLTARSVSVAEMREYRRIIRMFDFA
jgi:hypothetical protein